MKNLIIFSVLDPIGTAKRVSPRDIRREHGRLAASAILEGFHRTYKALYADIFLGKLRALLEELKE